MKKILFEPAWKLHSFHREIIENPPDGYEFVVNESLMRNIAQTAARTGFSYKLHHLTGRLMPLTLYRSQWARLSRKTAGVDLIYACEHLVFENKPWIVDTEYASLLVGFNIKHFARYRTTVETTLASPVCRKIICHTEAGKRSVLHNLINPVIEKKLEVVPLATNKKEFTKHPAGNKIKILFVGSSNILGEFAIKGGLETLEAFLLLAKRYKNVELVMRSDVPRKIKSAYAGYDNIRIIDQVIPVEELKREFESADIFLLPVHNTPYMSFLDAMSYELPVVTIDAWANSEVVQDGKTGFLVPASEKIPYYLGNSMPAFGTRDFEKAIRTPDTAVINGLYEKLSILIDNPELRVRMGKAGRWEVENGQSSVEKRNQQLKRIFDEATS